MYSTGRNISNHQYPQQGLIRLKTFSVRFQSSDSSGLQPNLSEHVLCLLGLSWAIKSSLISCSGEKDSLSPCEDSWKANRKQPNKKILYYLRILVFHPTKNIFAVLYRANMCKKLNIVKHIKSEKKPTWSDILKSASPLFENYNFSYRPHSHRKIFQTAHSKTFGSFISNNSAFYKSKNAIEL